MTFWVERRARKKPCKVSLSHITRKCNQQLNLRTNKVMGQSLMLLSSPSTRFPQSWKLGGKSSCNRSKRSLKKKISKLRQRIVKKIMSLIKQHLLPSLLKPQNRNHNNKWVKIKQHLLNKQKRPLKKRLKIKNNKNVRNNRSSSLKNLSSASLGHVVKKNLNN